MIPKKIHYFWFGKGDKPAKVKKCIASWRKVCPEYEIIEWNENNFDINMNEYTKYTYENKKFAFLSDYARLVVVYKYGGIYFDTDVELLRKPDKLLECKAFFGFENNENINTGHGFGSEKENHIVADMINEYHELKKDPNGDFILIPCPKLNTKALIKNGLVCNGQTQKLSYANIYSADYFNPYDDAKGKLQKTGNTISIHWYAKSWISKKAIIISKLSKPFHRLFGNDCFAKLKGNRNG